MTDPAKEQLSVENMLIARFHRLCAATRGEGSVPAGIMRTVEIRAFQKKGYLRGEGYRDMPASEGEIRRSLGNQAGRGGRGTARTRVWSHLETTLRQAAGISASRPPAVDTDTDVLEPNQSMRSRPAWLALHTSAIESGSRRAVTSGGNLEQQVNRCVSSRVVRCSMSQTMGCLIIEPAHELLDTRNKNRTRQLSPLSIDIVRPRPVTDDGLRMKMLISPESNHQARHSGTHPGPRSTQGAMADHPAALR